MTSAPARLKRPELSGRGREVRGRSCAHALYCDRVAVADFYPSDSYFPGLISLYHITARLNHLLYLFHGAQVKIYPRHDIDTIRNALVGIGRFSDKKIHYFDELDSTNTWLLGAK